MTSLKTEIIALADYVTISRENKLTIAGIFDRFFVEKLPVSWPNMFLAAVFKGQPESTHKIKVEIKNENNEVVFNQEMSLVVGSNGKANFVAGLQNFPLKTFGEHRILINEGPEQLADLRFTVLKRKKEGDGEIS